MTIELFIPCFIDQIYPQTAQNTVKILEKVGITVKYNPKQTCCGQPLFNSGYWKETAKVARKFLNDYSGENLIVSPSASCTAFVKNYYHELDLNSKSLEKFELIQNKLFELTDFLVNHLKIESTGAEFHGKITYHDACSALREYGLTTEARKLLNNVKGLELIEMKENDTCCGFGGTFSVKHSDISSAMAQQKVENALATGAEYIVSTEGSCLINIEGYIRKHKVPLQVKTVSDILASFD